MNDFLLGAAGFVLITVALGLARMVRAPDADYDPATGYSPGRSQVVERRHHLGL